MRHSADVQCVAILLSVLAFCRSTECVYRHSAALLSAYRHSAALLSAYRHSAAVLSAYRHSVAVLSVQASCCCTKCGHSDGVQCVGILLLYNVWAFCCSTECTDILHSAALGICCCTMCEHSAALDNV